MRLDWILLGIMFMFAVCVRAQEETNEPALTEQDKDFLVKLARQTLNARLKNEALPKPDKSALSDAVRQKGACFVTLEKRGSGLRGCIGIFERNRELYENVIGRAVAAAQDPRFPPVRYDELKDIRIEISVLTKPKELAFSSPEDLLAKLRPLKDGVLLYTRFGSSTFLPQVWEQLPDKEEFLGHLCQKHGAPADTWRKDHKNVKVETYEAIVFGEENYGGKPTDGK